MLRLIATAVLATALPVLAQGFNCTLLGTFDQFTTYNDVWGYVAPNGKEYALLGATTGLVVVDCSNPATPVQRGYFPWATSSWRDIRTYGTYAYVVSEGGGGFMVVNLANPDAPVQVGIVGTQYFGNCHNICVDTGTGRIYCIGTNNGTVVFDASVNPANPTYVGTLGTGAQADYFHDLCVENGYGYGSMIYNGVLRIWNASTYPPTTLSNTATPSAFTHNAWPNAAGTLCVTTDERAGGVVKFFDITNKSNPIPRGQFTPNSTSIPHNAFIKGNLCYVSWYTEGFRCIDISDPNNPVEVAYYDTWPGASGGYNGAWGVYPFQPSGNIYISDIQTGLYIVRLTLSSINLSHTPLGNTTNEDGPYPVTITATSPNNITGATLHWSTDGQNFSQAAMTSIGSNQYRANIPGQYAPTTVSYHIVVDDTNSNRREPATGEHTFIVGAFTQTWFDDVETDRGWTHGMVATQDDWQRGAPAGISGTSGGVGWRDPASAYSGSNVWGNDLGGAGFNGAYQNNVNNWLQSPAIPTNGAQGLRLRYARWLTVQNNDFGRVLINGNLVWQNTGAVSDTAWQIAEHDISAFTNAASTVTIRFELVTNGSGVAGGWNLDDIELFALSDCVPPVHYGTGTAGTGGIVPLLSLNGEPHINQSFQVVGGAMLGGSASFLGLSFAPANNPVFGITGLINNAGAAFLFAIATGPAGLPGIGTATWNLSVPNTPTLDNLDLFSQLLVLDSGSPGGIFAASDGMRIRVCRY